MGGECLRRSFPCMGGECLRRSFPYMGGECQRRPFPCMGGEKLTLRSGGRQCTTVLARNSCTFCTFCTRSAPAKRGSGIRQGAKYACGGSCRQSGATFPPSGASSLATGGSRVMNSLENSVQRRLCRKFWRLLSDEFSREFRAAEAP